MRFVHLNLFNVKCYADVIKFNPMVMFLERVHKNVSTFYSDALYQIFSITVNNRKCSLVDGSGHGQLALSTQGNRIKCLLLISSYFEATV